MSGHRLAPRRAARQRKLTTHRISYADPVGDQAPCLTDDPLSARERQIARLIVRGLSHAAIATHLGISAFTVGKHAENIYAKLGVHTREELIGHALRLGIV